MVSGEFSDRVSVEFNSRFSLFLPEIYSLRRVLFVNYVNMILTLLGIPKNAIF